MSEHILSNTGSQELLAMKEAYRSLLDQSWQGKKLYEQIHTQRLTAAPCFVGSRYAGTQTKLMVVGRAMNGWEIQHEQCDSLEHCVETVLTQKNRMDDIGKANGVPYTDINTGQKKLYHYSRSAFWRVIHQVVGEHDGWYQEILWANLFAVSPRNGGNPSEKLKAVQLEDCRKLLTMQIALYRPTHILFITDTAWWFSNFADLFPNVKQIGNSITDVIVAKGDYITEGIASKVIVTVRPDRTRPNKPDETRMAKAIREEFGLS